MKRTHISVLSLIIIFVYSTFHTNAQATLNRDSLSYLLDGTIEKKGYYLKQKEQRIIMLKQIQANTQNHSLQQYDINKNLYSEYKKYKSDMALHYLRLNKKLAEELADTELIYETDIQIAHMLSTTGLFVESKDILDNINPKALSPALLSQYYEVSGFYYDQYGQSNNDNSYYKKSDLYRDSLILSLHDKSSLKYKIANAENALYHSRSKDAEQVLIQLLNSTTDEDPERALIAYLLGAMYKHKGDKHQQECYFMISAITDITHVIKDNASLQSLALTYYENGNIDRAYKFMSSAIEDALDCKVKYRAAEALESYPIINAAYQNKEREQKDKLTFSLTLISILSFFLLITIIYIYRQMKKVSKIRKELYRSSTKLIELNKDITTTNEQLKEVNTQLAEVSHVKEEYIAHFFDLCSDYIRKMEEYRKSLNKLAANKSMDELYKTLKSTSLVDNELEDLYKKFDNIFLSLYPTFVDEFNALLIKEEQIILKPNELMNTELRIFALIRLGITDSVKIAGFLRYSLSTIYNYRTKARNKAAVSRDEFEEKVKIIGVIQKNR